LLGTRNDKDKLFAAISSGPDITIALVNSRPQASWNWAALSMNRRISLLDKLRHHSLPWTVMNRRRDEVPPIAVVMAQPDLPWDFKHLLQQWPLASILALAPDPHWLDWDEVSIRGAADFSLVLAHVSSRWTPSQLEAHVLSTSLIACGIGEF
jgi:hypothetical protein